MQWDITFCACKSIYIHTVHYIFISVLHSLHEIYFWVFSTLFTNDYYADSYQYFKFAKAATSEHILNSLLSFIWEWQIHFLTFLTGLVYQSCYFYRFMQTVGLEEYTSLTDFTLKMSFLLSSSCICRCRRNSHNDIWHILYIIIPYHRYPINSYLPINFNQNASLSTSQSRIWSNHWQLHHRLIYL